MGMQGVGPDRATEHTHSPAESSSALAGALGLDVMVTLEMQNSIFRDPRSVASS